MRANEHGDPDPCPRALDHHGHELHDDNAVVADDGLEQQDHDLEQLDAHLDLDAPARHRHRHAHRHRDQLDDQPTHLLDRLPVVPGLARRRLLPNGPSMRLRELPSHDDDGVSGTARPPDDRNDHHGNDDDRVANQHGRLPDGLLRVLGVLPGRVLPDRARLRLDVVPGQRQHDPRRLQRHHHRRPHRQRHHRPGLAAHRLLRPGLGHLRPRRRGRLLSLRLCL